MLFNLAKSFDSALLLSHCCYSIMCKSKYFCYLYISENDTPDNLQNVAPSDGERLWRKVVPPQGFAKCGAGTAENAKGGRGTSRTAVSRRAALPLRCGEGRQTGKLPVRLYTGRHTRRIFAALNIYNYKNDIPTRTIK